MNSIFNQILTEASKARFINKADLTDEEKDKYIKFFNAHPNLDNLVKWQDPNDVTREKLEAIYNRTVANSKEKKLSKQKYRQALDNGPAQLFLSRPNDFKIIDENDKFLFVQVLTYEGAKFCDSPECGGQGAKWCIGYEKTDEYWKSYTHDIEIPEEDDEEGLYDDYENGMYNNTFILAFNKDIHAPQNKLKYMLRLRIDDSSGEAWPQDDDYNNTIDIRNWPEVFGISSIETDIRPKIIGLTFLGYVTTSYISIGEISTTPAEHRITNFKEKVIIPEDIITIGTGAFKNAVFEDDVILPSSLKSIEESAFYKANFKNNIQLPDGLTNIGFRAFAFSNISEINIPSTIAYIGSSAFRNTLIKKVILPPNNIAIGDIFCECEKLEELTITGDTYLFSDPRNLKTLYHSVGHNIKLNLADTARYTIRDNIIIDKSTMAYIAPVEYLDDVNTKITELNILPYIKAICPICKLDSNIKSIYIPDGIETIGDRAFEDSEIESIRLPNTLKTIGSHAFAYCKLNGTLEIPESVTSIDSGAFYGCYDLLIFIPNNIKTPLIGEDSHIFNEPLSNYSYVDGILYNKNDMLVYFINTNSDTIIIPDGIKGFKFKVKDSYEGRTVQSVRYISNIKSIILPDSFILKDADFYGFESLQFISFPNSATNIPAACFCKCKEIKQISLPDNIQYINRSAFSGCSYLKQITLSPNLHGISNFAFNHTALEKIDLPKSLTYLEPAAFTSTNIGVSPDSISYNGTVDDFNNNVLIYSEESLKCYSKREAIINCLDGTTKITLYV